MLFILGYLSNHHRPPLLDSALPKPRRLNQHRRLNMNFTFNLSIIFLFCSITITFVSSSPNPAPNPYPMLDGGGDLLAVPTMLGLTIPCKSCFPVKLGLNKKQQAKTLKEARESAVKNAASYCKKYFAQIGRDKKSDDGDCEAYKGLNGKLGEHFHHSKVRWNEIKLVSSNEARQWVYRGYSGYDKRTSVE